MTNRFVKFAAAVAPAALLLAAGASPADAKVLLMGDGGWEVSFDGSVNGFAVWQSNDNLPATPAGQTGRVAGAMDTATANLDSFRVRTGLLPAVWGMNVKAPTTGGLDMAARIGIYPNISNNKYNSFGSTPDNQLDLREIFFTVDGSFGQVLVGKTLSQFLGKNILTDMTLFGVGATGGSHGAGTTLGRIGYGYVYPQFNARIQYTTPDMSGFKVSVGVYDPSTINATNNTAGGFSASKTTTPRFEGEASWAGSLMGTTDLFWISGLWQDAEFSGLTGAGFTGLNGRKVDSWGFAGGLQVSIPVGPGTVELMGSGYTGQALGTTLLLDTNSLDFTGHERDNYGFIGQGGYAFGQGTKIQASYGESDARETTAEENCRNGLASGDANFACGTEAASLNVQRQDLIDVMLTHDVNPNLKLVAEYGRQRVEWFDGADQSGDVFGLGAFFFW